MVKNILSRFARAQHGNVATIFAIATLPMIGMIGLGVDASRTMSARTSIQAAADAAALAAVTTALNTLQSSNTNMNSQSQATTNGQTAGTNVFNANAARVMQWTGQTITPSVNVPAPVNNVVTATVTYSASVPTVFGKMFKVNQFSFSGNAKSSLTLPSYINITVLIDNSESMGFAATTADAAKLQALTSSAGSGKCAFGCHVVQANQYGSKNYEDLAHSNNVTLRTDVIQTGVQNMIQQAKDLGYSNPLISFTLYTFNKTLSKPLGGLTQSTDYTSLITAAGNIDIDQSPAAGGETSESTIMKSFASTVPASGDGSTAAKAKQYVFLMTDGVDDLNASRSSDCSSNAPYNSTYGACFGPADCTALVKNTTATVGVIYTQYLPEPGITLWDNIVKPFSANIDPAMQKCASQDWYYSVTQASEISAAINKLFQKAVNAGILIQ